MIAFEKFHAQIRIVLGRLDSVDSPRVAIVSEALAERFWPDESPLGRVLRADPFNGGDLEIVGVARQVKVRSLGEAPRPLVYLSHDQRALSHS